VTSSGPYPALPALHRDLPAGLTAPRRARAAVRDALARWGLDDLTGDAELIASEITANAAEHTSSTRIGFSIWPCITPDGRRGIFCQITDASPLPPRPKAEPEPGSERGRGLHIVSALATTTGITTTPQGKIAWFTLTRHAPEPAATRHAVPELEAG
jgi:anti-sigma regulatory factor (Ser/Thr protein kinase)